MASYCAKYLPKYLKSLDEYKRGQFEEALKKLFLKFDESLLTPESQKELSDIRDMVSKNNSVKAADDQKNPAEAAIEEEEDMEEDDIVYEEGEKVGGATYQSETDALYDEACMPIEEVLKRYSSTECKVRKALRKKGVIKPGPSPMITAPGSSSTTTCIETRRNLLAEEDGITPKKPLDFAKQEELDINEIKQNSHPEGDLSTIPHDPQEYDEASNLGDVNDSQRSTSACDQSSLHTSEVLSKSLVTTSTSILESTTTSAAASHSTVTTSTIKTVVTNTGLAVPTNAVNLPDTPSKLKLNKEEIKLSPIQNKSMSSSSLLIDADNSSDAHHIKDQVSVWPMLYNAAL